MRRTLLATVVVLSCLLLPSTASALEPGKILGTVTPAAVAPEVEVCLVENPPSEICAAPGSNGRYELSGVPLGQVRVEFLPSHRSGYAVQYYENASSLAAAKTITLTGTSREKLGVDANLVLGGGIEGTVTASVGGSAVEGVEVCAVFAGTRVVAGCIDTESSGDYSLSGIAAGSYKVGFFPAGKSSIYSPQYYDAAATFAAATPTTVTAGGTVTGVDAELNRGGTIQGTLASVFGARLGGVSVCLFTSGTSRPQICGFSSDSGEYAFEGLVAGSYQVGFSLSAGELNGEGGAAPAEDGFSSQYWNGVSNRNVATQISVLPSATVSGIDAALAPPPAPPAAPLVPIVAAPIIAAPVVISEPVKKKKTAHCKAGYKKKKVKGKLRCVKVRPKHQNHRKKQRHKDRGGQ